MYQLHANVHVHCGTSSFGSSEESLPIYLLCFKVYSKFLQESTQTSRSHLKLFIFKWTDDGEYSKLFIFKWTSLLIPPTTLLIINIVRVIVGVSDAINNWYDSWRPLFGRLLFALWVIVHLYPFLKEFLGKQDR